VILILTYHKISAGAGTGGSDFYSVTRHQLTEQFQALAATGRQCVPVSAVRERAALPRNNFVLSFDDGTADHCEIVLPLLRERGWTASFFVPTSKLNRPGYLTDAQVRELARAGHCIGCHSHDHRRLDLATDDQMREQISRSQQIIGNLIGGKPWLFAPVGGFMNEHVREVALGFGIEVIRTMRWGYNQAVDPTALETIPINRHTDGARFQKILEARQTRYMYFGKQAMKALVPSRAYEKMRALLFKLAGRN
jgi:peptidoglycan/xylan/chitin deacetylase (PgdA/CDA1 family)